jgi:hypothetical protein
VQGRSGRISIVGPVEKILVRVGTPVVHGVPFAVTARALDSLGSTVVTITGPATWSSRDGGLVPASPVDFIKGVSTTTATVPSAFHDDRITVQIAGLTGKSNYFAVN